MKSNWRAAIISLAVLLVLVGAAGWYLAVVRASELAAARNIRQADDMRMASLGNDKDALQQKVDGLQAQLATARQSADQAQAALAIARSNAEDAAALHTQLADANARAAAATTQLQALRQKQPTRESMKAPQSHAAAPMFDLPASAGAHAYLAAAQQAMEAGNLAKARAALGRAEVRSLNAAQLGRPPTAEERERSRKIQNAIDLLDAGRKASAREVIKTLLAGMDQASAP